MSTSPEQIFIGIDVSKATLDLAFRGQARAHQFANTDAGVAQLVASLGEHKSSVACVLLEATGGLQQRAVTALCLAGYSVIVSNPRQAHDFTKSLGLLSKTDQSDARALAQYAHMLWHSDKREKLLTRLATVDRKSVV